MRGEPMYEPTISDEQEEEMETEDEEIEPKKLIKQDANRELRQIKKEFQEPEIFLVKAELPTQPFRRVKLDDGSIANLVTYDEALTEIMNDLKDIKTALLGNKA